MSEQDPTVWQIMSSSTRDLMAAKAALPLVIAMIYGGYKFYQLGTAIEHYLYTYVPVVGGIVAILGIMAYSAMSTHDRRGWSSFLAAISGWFPYLMSLYMMGFLGIYKIWISVSPFTLWGVIQGMIWLFLGYRVLRKFWIITELGSLRVDGSDLAETLVAKLRMGKRDLLPLLQDRRANEYIEGRSRSNEQAG